MTTRFTNFEALVPFAKLRAQRGLFDGLQTASNMRMIENCRHLWVINPEVAAMIIFTRDVGHHSGGWWKNPDYERCWHLSVTFLEPNVGVPYPHDLSRSRLIAEAFFGDDAKLTWLEAPYTPQGKARDCWHYRLFADLGWQPIKPRGEVYSTDWTPEGWKSFSDVHAAEDA